MEALVERLSHLDAEAGGAVRVVMFFDTLIRRRVDLPALARASAGLAECVVGIDLRGGERALRVTPTGETAPAAADPATAASTTVPVLLDDETIGVVWLERTGPPGGLDRLLLDRLAIGAASVVERYGPARTTMADPALVELVISDGSDDAARARALRLLGFAPDAPVRVVAVRSAAPLDRVGARICPGRPVKAAEVGGVGVLLATTVDAARFPEGVRAGIGRAALPARGWHEARTALRFTTPRRPVLHVEELGALALIAQVPADVARADPDVAALERLAGTPEDLETLEAFCETGSLRRAADLLHRHHSSVARRLELVGRELGIELTSPAGLLRAQVALTARRLLDP